MEFNLRPFDGFEYENQAGAFSFRYDARSQTWQPSQIGVSQNLAPKKKITENGLIYYYIETGDGPIVSDQAFIPHPSENMIVKIELARNESYRDCITPCPEAKPFSDDQTIEQILSTFKFIQKEQKSENSTLSTYQNETVTFKFPVEWIQKPILVRGSGFTQEFEDPTAKFHLTFSTSGNYSQVTGKPYANIDDYVNMPYQVKTLEVDDQEARQPLPRAGSENINSVVFFSLDSKFIYTLELKTDISKADIEEGQELFDLILSTFKFFRYQ